MTAKTILSSVAIRNFKALRDTGAVRLTPLTAIIGNNGAGKSSIIEGLETLRTFATVDVDAAMQMWRGIEHVRNKAKQRQTRFAKTGEERSSKPIEFHLRGRCEGKSFSTSSVINERGRGNELFVEHEEAKIGTIVAKRVKGRMDVHGEREQTALGRLDDGESLLGHVRYLSDYIRRWQFLTLVPQAMGNPAPQTRTRGDVALHKNGDNIAEYVQDIRRRDLAAFEGLIESLKFVLPYAVDLQPTLTSELERTVYLQLTEGQFKVPGWLLSTGTLRILALLALLRHPAPPPLIVIEEIENGLDPRTIHLLVGEIQEAVESGRTQVVMTTHSPYLLDLLPLSSIVLADRVDGEPKFTRPADSKGLKKWAESFGPGQLYTMNRLRESGAGK